MEYFHPQPDAALLDEETYIASLEAVRERLQPCRMEEDFTSFDGAKLHWQGYLTENARAAVVILHGFTEFPEKYLELTWYFVNRGYHVFLPTLRGHDSGEAIHVERFEDYVRDLHCMISGIRNVTQELPLYLYAHSMGGAVGARYLQEYPDAFQKAVLTAPMFCPRASDVPYPVALLGSRALLLRGGRKRSCLFCGGYNPNVRVEQSNAASEGRFRWNLKCRAENAGYRSAGATNRWVYEALALRRRVLCRRNCRKIRVPVLVFSAGRDTQVRTDVQQTFVSRVPTARLECYPQEKHELFSTKNEVLKDYLQKIFAFFEEA